MMLASRAGALTTEGLRNYVDYLDRELARVMRYETFQNTIEGKFLIEELVQRREFIRGMYSAIQPESRDAPIMLAAMQAYEREVDEWLKRMTKTKVAEDDLRKERETLAGMVERRKPKDSINQQHFVPTFARDEKQKREQSK